MRSRVAFDTLSAFSLLRALEHAADTARSGGGLYEAFGIAIHDFQGGYARAFEIVSDIASADRGRLFTVLTDLYDQVRLTIRLAENEQERLDRWDKWRYREEERQRVRAATGGLGALTEDYADREPHEDPVRNRPLFAVFMPQDHPRYSPGGGGGVSSADPERLRHYARIIGFAADALDDDRRELRDAWARFTTSCPWARVDRVDVLEGFERFIHELEEDGRWIARVADLFATAGGEFTPGFGCGVGSPTLALSDAVLDLATRGTPLTDAELLRSLATLTTEQITSLLDATPHLRTRLLALDPVVVNDWWTALAPPADSADPFSERQLLLLTAFPTLFGNLEGLPYVARDHANRIALDAAIIALEAGLAEIETLSSQWRLDELDPAEQDKLLQRVQDDRAQLAALKNIRAALRQPRDGASRYLTALTEDRPPLGAVSIGNLDTATSVTFAVPGMNTTTKGMTGFADAAQNIHTALGSTRSTSAVVAWIGYDTPNPASVLSSDLAKKGGAQLARTLRGLDAVRADGAGSPPDVSLVAHSYGTTTAAVALTTPGIHVNTVVMLASPGLPDTVTDVSDLHADRVYSGAARDVFPGLEDGQGDQWRRIGRLYSVDHRVDPMKPTFGAELFGTDTGGRAGEPVTDHGLLVAGDEADDGADDNEGHGYLDRDTESLKNTVRAIAHRTDELTPHTPKDPSFLQNALVGTEVPTIEGLPRGR